MKNMTQIWKITKKKERNWIFKSTFGVTKLDGKSSLIFFAEVRDLMEVIYKIKYHKKLGDTDSFRFIRTDQKACYIDQSDLVLELPVLVKTRGTACPIEHPWFEIALSIFNLQ